MKVTRAFHVHLIAGFLILIPTAVFSQDTPKSALPAPPNFGVSTIIGEGSESVLGGEATSKTNLLIRQDTSDILTPDFGRQIVNSEVLQEESAYQVAKRAQVDVSEAGMQRVFQGLREVSVAYRGESEAGADCQSAGTMVSQRIISKHSEILRIVDQVISENPDCSCEVVKNAILTSSANSRLVGDIVRVAISAAPDQQRIIAQCAIAVSPESLDEIQVVFNEFDPDNGDGSDIYDVSKEGVMSAQSAKDGIDGSALSSIAPPDQIADPLNLMPSEPQPIIVPNPMVDMQPITTPDPSSNP